MSDPRLERDDDCLTVSVLAFREGTGQEAGRALEGIMSSPASISPFLGYS